MIQVKTARTYLGLALFTSIYLLISFLGVRALCYLWLKLLQTDAGFSFEGYYLPCHAHSPIVPFYGKVTAFIFLSGPVVVSLLLLALSVTILFTRLKRYKALRFTGYLLLNVYPFNAFSGLFILGLLYFFHRRRFFDNIDHLTLFSIAAWIVVLTTSVALIAWSIRRFVPRIYRVPLAVIVPVMSVICYILWFRLLGPALLPY